MGHISGGKQCPMVILLKLFLQITATVSSQLANSMTVSFEPKSLQDLSEYSSTDVNVTLRFPQDIFEKSDIEEYYLKLDSFHPETATGDISKTIKKSDFRLKNSQYEKETVIQVNGNLLGKTAMKIRLVSASDWLETNETEEEQENFVDKLKNEKTREGLFDVWVVRSAESRQLTKYFVLSVVILISMANVMMGCELDLDAVIATLKKPVAPAIGLFAQFIIMPLLSYLIAYAIFMPRGLYSMALGLFVTGCSPGGGASNFWTLLLDGNLNLSVTMTFISTMCSLVMMPLWLHFLGHPFLQGFSSDATIKVPYTKIVSSLIALIIPLLIGIAIKKWKPTWAGKARGVMRPFVIFVMIFVVIFGSLTNLYMFRMLTIPALIGGLALPWCGFMFGCFVALLTKRAPEDVTAIAVETGIQNTGIAILLLKASFGQPDADIGSLLPVIVAAFTPGPLLLGAAVHLTFKAMRKRQQAALDNGSVEKQAIELVDENIENPRKLKLVDENLLPPTVHHNLLTTEQPPPEIERN
ncbi:unnamed protein product [Caenorhabditis angaria]|uniref:Uncharacterized protein n=1 Tax=Caenorhabditis angaria TaxID=860376 RepID=A0A9P1INB7_9PELO|nr:unnamed protein product [Caenorhabditis angaria]